MPTAEVREFNREVRRLVGAVGKVVRSLNWHEGQSGVRQRHFHEKWKRAEVDNIIGEQKRLNRKLTAAELAVKVKDELFSRVERFKKSVVSAAPKKALKQKKAE